MTKEKKTKKTDARLEELTNLLKKVQADFENYKKRVEKEKQDFATYASSQVISKLLVVVDSFEQAMKNTDKPEEFVKGMKLIQKQLITALEAEGVRPIEAKGKKFDPYKHEVLLNEKSNQEENIILEELQKGYMFKDKVLRHAKVKVSKNG